MSILEKHFDSETIAHIMLMESETETDVIITDTNNNIIASSNSLLNKYVDSQISERTTNEDFLVGNWKDDDFIFTVNAIGNNGKEVGLVYTFQNTDKIHILVKKLNENFFFVGVFTLILTFIVITFLSYALAKPLVKMKEATSKIIEGDFSISLPNIKNEELGDLSKSITRLAKDLNYLQLERKGFLDSISHELKTPLTLIKGYADIIYNRELSDEEKDKYIVIIRKEAHRLSILIKDLFTLAKMDKNAFKIEKKEIRLDHLFYSIEEKFMWELNDKNMELITNCPRNLSIIADPFRLEQILYNLIDNSLKYSFGTKIYLSAQLKNGYIYITTSDNGVGIPKEDIPYIFNRFYRVDKSRKRSSGGAGLGLSIVKEIVFAHGGEISFTSKNGKGTQFEIIFQGDEQIENDFNN
ncbi:MULTISPECIES: HAMP domain-containing sensor histidine kinase [Cytobacillus]|uniref:HAMP domain-containing sensor histidine kinase n=1 Tax=Cytobacillus TaxID=2675230 RepID=UPI00296FD720|nr:MULTISPECIES: HAMP domain-containing sensor histidine kinase [Cytobacillus]